MARGKKSLLETTELPIITTDIEEGQIPYFILDDEWGISCDDRNEILVHKRVASRTIKDESGVEIHVEQYFMWESISYPSTFTKAIELYVDKKGKAMKSKIVKSKDYNDLISIQNDIKTTITKALDFNSVNKDFLAITSILDERAKLEEQLKLLRETKEQVICETEKLLQLVKEKRSIIMSNTEPTKHRNKEENGDV
jgi:hypothetical protein